MTKLDLRSVEDGREFRSEVYYWKACRRVELAHMEVLTAAPVARQRTMGHVEGTPTLKDDTNNAETAYFNRRNQKAMTTIVMAVSQSVTYKTHTKHWINE